MRRRFRTIIWSLLGALAAIALVLLGLYQALVTVPGEYREVVEANPEAQREASDEMLQQATALASDVRKEGDWEAQFTEEQINGWLAVDLIENHPTALPAGISAPRVSIHDDTLALYCRLKSGRTDTVLTLLVEPYVDEANTVALRFHKVRAGLLPLPMGKIVEKAGHVARELELKLAWRQTEGDPVALITVPTARDAGGKVIRIEQLQLREGEIYISGKTGQW